jgi:hypothetical protein
MAMGYRFYGKINNKLEDCLYIYTKTGGHSTHTLEEVVVMIMGSHNTYENVKFYFDDLNKQGELLCLIALCSITCNLKKIKINGFQINRYFIEIIKKTMCNLERLTLNNIDNEWLHFDIESAKNFANMITTNQIHTLNLNDKSSYKFCKMVLENIKNDDTCSIRDLVLKNADRDDVIDILVDLLKNPNCCLTSLDIELLIMRDCKKIMDACVIGNTISNLKVGILSNYTNVDCLEMLPNFTKLTTLEIQGKISTSDLIAVGTWLRANKDVVYVSIWPVGNITREVFDVFSNAITLSHMDIDNVGFQYHDDYDVSNDLLKLTRILTRKLDLLRSKELNSIVQMVGACQLTRFNTNSKLALLHKDIFRSLIKFLYIK